MRRATGLTRLLWRITALLQLFLPLAISAADAQLEREAAGARAFSHIEATTGKDCARAHSPECALCQHLTSSFTRPGKTPPVSVRRPELPPVERGAIVVAPRNQRPSLPRAPPVV
jgi:hypothetical protein